MTLLAPEKTEIATLPSLPFPKFATLPTCAALYFVFDSSHEVLYIGRAQNLQRRWKAHHRALEYASVPGLRLAWLVVDDSDLLVELEHRFIEYFRPSDNRLGYTKGTKRLAFRLPLAWYEALEREAAKRNRSMNEQLMDIIEQFLREARALPEEALADARHPAAPVVVAE